MSGISITKASRIVYPLTESLRMWQDRFATVTSVPDDTGSTCKPSFILDILWADYGTALLEDRSSPRAHPPDIEVFTYITTKFHTILTRWWRAYIRFIWLCKIFSFLSACLHATHVFVAHTGQSSVEDHRYDTHIFTAAIIPYSLSGESRTRGHCRFTPLENTAFRKSRSNLRSDRLATSTLSLIFG